MTKSRWLGWWKACAATIGTWVRFPGPPNSLFPFFSIHSHAGFMKESTINLTLQLAKWSRSLIQRPGLDERRALWSTMRWTIRKSKA